MMCLSTKALTLHTLPVQSSAFDPKLSQYDANLSLLEQVIPNIYVSCISVWIWTSNKKAISWVYWLSHSFARTLDWVYHQVMLIQYIV